MKVVSRVAESEFFGWTGIPNNTEDRSRIFCPTPDLQLDFLNHTPKMGIPVEMVVSLETFVEREISCCAAGFPLIVTAKFHSFMEPEILQRSEWE